MEILNLIQLADTAPQIMSLLAGYVESLRGAGALPEWWFALPLENTDQARQSVFALMGLVHGASRRLDDGVCATAKQALGVFAVALSRIDPAGRRRP
jgi:hypothetical protein